MTSFKTACLMALVASMALPAQSVSPVQKVLALIDEMLAKVKADTASRVTEFETFSNFCDKSATEKEYAMASSDKAIEAVDAAIVNAKASIASLESHIQGVTTKISDVSTEMANSIALREKENEDFMVSEKQLAEDVDTIKAVIQAQALTQMTPGAHQSLDAIKNGLSHLAEAGLVMHGSSSKVAALMQAQDDGDESPETDTLGVVQQNAENALKGARDNEAAAQFSHASLKQGLEYEIQSLNKELAESTQSKQKAAEELAAAEKDLAVELKGKADDLAFLQDLQRDYNSKARDFEVEFKDANGELKALGSAKAILEKKFAAFLQTGSHTTLRLATRARDDMKSKALRMIQQLGKRLHSTALVALAYRAAADPFAKVRAMVEDMLVKLQQEAAEAATQEAFCNEENGKSTKSKAIKEQDLAKINARMEKAESAVATLAEQTTMLSKEVADLDAEMTQSQAIRTSEKATFVKVELDLSESKDACGAAIQVLREYYDGATSLLQVRMETRAKTQARDGSGILGVLEFTASDFEKQLSDERVAEREASEKFEKLIADSKMLRAMKEMELKSKLSESKGLKSRLFELSEDKEGTSTELDAVVEYLAELKPKCAASAPPTYAEKKAKRDAEMEGLKEALKLLE